MRLYGGNTKQSRVHAIHSWLANNYFDAYRPPHHEEVGTYASKWLFAEQLVYDFSIDSLIFVLISGITVAGMCSGRPWDDEHMSLLLKPRSPGIAIFLTVSEKGIATSETQKPTQQLHTVYPQDKCKLASRTGFDGCHPSHQLEFLALGEDCQHTHIYGTRSSRNTRYHNTTFITLHRWSPSNGASDACKLTQEHT
jgi:hypothetical protein